MRAYCVLYRLMVTGILAALFLGCPDPSEVTTYTLTMNVTGNGSVSPPGGTYDENQSVQLTATAEAGSRFLRWEGDLTGTDNPADLAMTADRDITAVFEPIPATYDLTIAVTGNGSVSPSDGTYDEDESVQLTATAEAGSRFSHWEGDLTGTENPADIVMTDDRNITAVFEPIPVTYDLTITVTGNGSVSPPGATYDEDQSVELTATADAGSRFLRWEGDLTGSGNPDSIVMNSDRNVTAVFVLNTEMAFDFYATYTRIIDEERHGVSLWNCEVDMDNAGSFLAGYAFDEDYWYAFTVDAEGLAPRFWPLDFTGAYPRAATISPDGTRAYVASDYDGDSERYPVLLKMAGEDATRIDLPLAADEGFSSIGVIRTDTDGTGVYMRDGIHHHIWHCDQNGLNFVEVIDPDDYVELDGTRGLWISEFDINDSGGDIAFVMERWR